MIRTLSALTLASALLMPLNSLTAQDSDKWIPKGWEISPFIGVFDDMPEFDPAGGGSVFVDPAKNVLAGAHVSYNLSNGLFLDVEGAFFPQVMRTATGDVDMNLLLYGVGVGYNIPLTKELQAYGLAGVGASRWDPEGFASETDLALNYAAGARVSLTRWLALRGEARMHQVPDALANTAAALAGTTLGKETFWGWGFSLGASLFLGSGRLDGDRDGVGDAADRCPNTPMGVTVDARGCGVDSDGDRVADHSDRCPDTPMGARVDRTGCPSDADNDGVFDGLDRCPNTVSGARVDAIGCAVPEPEPEPEPVVSVFTFRGVNFPHDSAVLGNDTYPLLDEAGRALSARSGERIQVIGHTDSSGTEAYNRALSLRRAQAVRAYLLANFPGLGADRVEVQGAGESRPVADNGTAAGRRQNRRVEILLGGGR